MLQCYCYTFVISHNAKQQTWNT